MAKEIKFNIKLNVADSISKCKITENFSSPCLLAY